MTLAQFIFFLWKESEKNESDEKVRHFSHSASLYCIWVQWCNTFSSADWVDVRFLVTQVLPNGIAWIPQLVQTITQVALNKSESIHVDKKLIDGPNPNQTGKWWIPLIIVAQVSFLNSRAYTVLSFLYWMWFHTFHLAATLGLKDIFIWLQFLIFTTKWIVLWWIHLKKIRGSPESC